MANFGGKDPREYCISTKRFVLDDEGKLKGLDTVRVEWTMVSSFMKCQTNYADMVFRLVGSGQWRR
jgi:hypothetical protein